MTIWQILLWWLISELLAWGIWYVIIYRNSVKKLGTLTMGMHMSIEIDEYVKTQNKFVEWIRFIVWPYGVVQRTIVCNNIIKKIIQEDQLMNAEP